MNWSNISDEVIERLSSIASWYGRWPLHILSYSPGFAWINWGK